MALEAYAETWLRVSTEIATARLNDMLLRIRRGELVDASKFDAMIYAFTHRVRDQLMSALARHAAVLAAERGLDPGGGAAGTGWGGAPII